MDILILTQIIVSVLLILSIMLQTRGTQAGIAFGGGGETYRSKKGIEKFLLYATIILAVFFAAVSVLAVLF